MQHNIKGNWLDMKIGLVRHFRVKMKYPSRRKLISQNEVMDWFRKYDRSEIEEAKTDLQGIHWDKCYSSDLPRAAATARLIYKGPVLETEVLRELKLQPIFKKDVKLPFWLWPVIIRIAWYFNHKSQIKHKLESLERIRRFIDEMLTHKSENILIVSHGAIMRYLRKELLKHGLKGPKFRMPLNGVLYIFDC